MFITYIWLQLTHQIDSRLYSGGLYTGGLYNNDNNYYYNNGGGYYNGYNNGYRTDECYTDNDCVGRQKCCQNFGYRQCANPLYNG
jgi:hypothetical protein